MKELRGRVRDSVRDDLASIAERIQKETGATIPEVRRIMRELLACSV